MTPKPLPSLRRNAPAYTLVEMLIVLAIVVSLFAVAASGFKKSWQSQELRASAIQLATDLSLASQTAIRLGQSVQVRFYKYQAIELATDKPQFFAYQLMVRDKVVGLASPLYELQRFQGTTIMSENPVFSTIAYTKPTKAHLNLTGNLSELDPAIGIGEYEYLTIEFRPNGSTNLDPDASEPWSITLLPVTSVEELPNQSKTKPVDFQTLTINPSTGSVRIWQ